MMIRTDVARRRLAVQGIFYPLFDKPREVVAWLGAVQAQDYLGSLWAVGLRLPEATETSVERALSEREIVRTWPMRGTLHLVAAADVRWMLELLTPRVVAGSAGHYRRLGLDEGTFALSRKLFVKALRGGRQLTRPELYRRLEEAGISTAESRGLNILGRLAQERLICFGARAGKQQRFALLDEWLPEAKSMPREEALAELAKRYFRSRGPATVQDFAWWSGLTNADAASGVGLAKEHLSREVIEGRDYWFSTSAPVAEAGPRSAHLLPAYDEYTVAYRDRSAVLDPLHARRPDSGNGIFGPTLVVGGQVVGTWKRTLKKGSVEVALNPFRPLKKNERQAAAAAAQRYGAFLGLQAALVESTT
jgi:hypothetical protein